MFSRAGGAPEFYDARSAMAAAAALVLIRKRLLCYFIMSFVFVGTENTYSITLTIFTPYDSHAYRIKLVPLLLIDSFEIALTPLGAEIGTLFEFESEELRDEFVGLILLLIFIVACRN